MASWFSQGVRRSAELVGRSTRWIAHPEACPRSAQRARPSVGRGGPGPFPTTPTCFARVQFAFGLRLDEPGRGSEAGGGFLDRGDELAGDLSHRFRFVGPGHLRQSALNGGCLVFRERLDGAYTNRLHRDLRDWISQNRDPDPADSSPEEYRDLAPAGPRAKNQAAQTDLFLV